MKGIGSYSKREALTVAVRSEGSAIGRETELSQLSQRCAQLQCTPELDRSGRKNSDMTSRELMSLNGKAEKLLGIGRYEPPVKNQSFYKSFRMSRKKWLTSRRKSAS